MNCGPCRWMALRPARRPWITANIRWPGPFTSTRGGRVAGEAADRRLSRILLRPCQHGHRRRLAISGCGQRLSASSPNCMRRSASDTPAAASGDILIAGSSTVFPSAAGSAMITRQGLYRQHQRQHVGTGAGIAEFCTDANVEIVDASRPITRGELKRVARPSASRLNSGSATMPWQCWSAGTTALSRTLPWHRLARYLRMPPWSDVDPSWPTHRLCAMSPASIAARWISLSSGYCQRLE